MDNLKKRKVEYENPYFQLAKDLFYIEMEPPLKHILQGKETCIIWNQTTYKESNDNL